MSKKLCVVASEYFPHFTFLLFQVAFKAKQKLTEGVKIILGLLCFHSYRSMLSIFLIQPQWLALPLWPMLIKSWLLCSIGAGLLLTHRNHLESQHSSYTVIEALEHKHHFSNVTHPQVKVHPKITGPFSWYSLWNQHFFYTSPLSRFSLYSFQSVIDHLLSPFSSRKAIISLENFGTTLVNEGSYKQSNEIWLENKHRIIWINRKYFENEE